MSYAVYLEKFIWPSNLAVFYPYTEPTTLAWIASAIAIATITVLALRRPYLTVGWLWYLRTLIPVIRLVQVGSQSRADRYMYLPLIGICIMIAWSASEFVKNRRALIAGAIAVAAIWSILTWRNLENWQNSETLFVHALQSTENNFVAYNNLGDIRRRQGRFEEAASNFANAVRIQPQSLEAQDNLGEALTTLGKSEEAIPHLTAAVRLRPDLAKPHIDLGSALVRSAATRLRPDFVNAHLSPARALAALGRKADAIAEYTETLRLAQDLEEAHNEMKALNR